MKKQRSHIYRGLASIFLALLVIFGLVSQVANSWSGKVNELLGISDNTMTRSGNPADYRFTSDYASGSDLINAEIALNTRMEAEGAVTLKGMPAVAGRKVTLFGMRSGAKMQFGGSMGELVDSSNVVTLADALTANGFDVNPAMVEFIKRMETDYAPSRSSGGNIIFDYEDQGSKINEIPVSEYKTSDIGEYTDAAILVFGRDAGESACFYPGPNGMEEPAEFTGSPTGNIFSLTNEERGLVNFVKQQGFGKIVVLLNSGTSMEIEELKADSAVDCLMWIGNPGAYGTYGIAKLLSGELLPSGHLPDTFAVNSAKSAAAQNLGVYTFTNYPDIDTTNNNGLRSSWYLVEAEGIYTGYKYYETRYYDCIMGQGNAAYAAHNETAGGGTVWNYDNEVSYTFGYGMEGSTFSEEITESKIDWSGAEESTVTVKVTNTGDAAAKHAVQLYVSLPYTDEDRKNGLEKSAIQLIGYGKTGEAKEKTFADYVLLAPGESEDITIRFNAQDIYSYDKAFIHDGFQGAYVLSAGDYYFATGNGAHEAVNAVLNAQRGSTLETTGACLVQTLADEMHIIESHGVTIQNRMTDAELNTWNTNLTVTYLSRSDWAGTFPVSMDGLTATDAMITYLRNATYDAAAERAHYDGATVFTYGVDNGIKAVDLAGLSYDDPKYELALQELTLQDLANQYIAYLEELRTLAVPKESPADSPLGLIAKIGQRTAGTIFEVSSDDPAFGHMTNVYVGGPVVAATFSPLLQSEEGRLIANDALWSGYNDWYGPGMNLHRTPYNLRNIAYYSEDAVLTGMTGTYVHTAAYKLGLVTATKHFAFNDQETNRDGIAVFMSEQAARENELRGFQIAIRSDSVKGMMSAFNRVGCTHIAAHRGVMNGILRGEWGWNGYLMTDSVKSSAYFLPRECIMAGNDMMLGGSNNGSIWKWSADALADDPVLQSAVRESYHRKLYTFANSSLLNGMTNDSGSSGAVVWWVLTLRIIMGVMFVGLIAFTTLSIMAYRKERRQ
ncbi:MAG: glycoside hydrolase family 3 C-terminal domain-containing protein [Clostridia bacterium]|nr:glycoside hydrolase family 3 C-terminal domain-containing protein [Clostridia bacterium]